MPKKAGPDMKRYMDKKIRLTLNAKRVVSGQMRGFDQFMNIVLDEAYEERSETEGFELGTVVIRGNSIVQMEILDALEKPTTNIKW